MRRRAFLLILTAPVLLAACGGSGEAVPPETALRKAHQLIDTATGIAIELTASAPVPPGRNGVSAAKGVGIVDATTPKFKGRVEAVISGTPGGVEIIGIGDQTWMSFFTSTLTKVDVNDLGAPNPALLFKPGTGLASILTKATDATAGEEKRLGKEVLQTYHATVPGSVVQDLLRLGDGSASFDAVLAIEPTSGQLREAKLTGAFYPEVSATYTLVLTDYGKTIDIPTPG